MAEPQTERIRQCLTEWYSVHQRDLPWRRTSDPYAIWVSETMLQQTRVATARDYFRRFLQRFPTVADLADAPLEDVLKIWEGLGYYSRARNLHRAARMVVDEFDGRLPDTANKLKTLPGIGRYTAGAVASIAFGLDEPVLDGNVKRVLCRVYAIEEDPRKAATERTLWDIARDLVPPGRAGLFNQALMDLGATICTPRKPDCPRCPLQKHCLAFARNLQERLPIKPPRKKIPHHTIVVGLVFREGKILIGRRPVSAMLGGLWEFPGGKVEKGESLLEALHREIREEVGLEIASPELLVVVKHAYSHFRITLHAFRCEYRSGDARPIECEQVRWVAPAELDSFPFPRANRRIIEALQAG
ncbi:MAG: A/G-specific adenine glycosylase [Phycisphaerae bacterium]